MILCASARLGTVAAVIVLAGCSTGPQPPLSSIGSPQRLGRIAGGSPDVIDPRLLVARDATKAPLLLQRPALKPMATERADIFLSDVYDGLVNGFSLKTGQLVEQLTGFSLPQGLATDRKGNLYVAATGNSAVYVFGRGATSPSLILDDASWYPTGAAVSISGEVAVANKYSTSYGQGNVSFFKPGQSEPYNTVSGSIMTNPEFCAYDARGNLYVIGGGRGAGRVVEVVRGGKGSNFKDLGINNIMIAGGVEIDRNGNGDILALDQNSNTIDRYWPRHHKLIGTTFLQNGGDNVTFALTPPRENYIYSADFGNGGGEKFPFPYGGPPIRTIPSSNAIGVALSPWARP